MLQSFADEQGVRITNWFIENESGATLDRPELFAMLNHCQRGDVIIVEQIDRLSRLTTDDWLKLRALIDSKGIRVVSLDLPTSWQILKGETDDFSGRIFGVLNNMLLDMLAAVARKDYEDRRRRQRQGIDRAKLQGRFPGKQPNKERHAQIKQLRAAGMKIDEIVKLTGAGRSTVFKVLQVNKK